MIDISDVSSDGLEVFDSLTPRATNILSVQLGALEYASELGIDLRYFLDEALKFENESFKSYLVQVLANNGINVSTVEEELQSLYNELTFNISPEENSTGMVAR